MVYCYCIPIAHDLEVQRKLDACRQATKDKGSVHQIIMQGIFFGLPCSGKTSTKQRLLGKRLREQQPSTGVAEKASHVEIEKTTVHFVSRLIWNEVTDLSEEAAMVVDDISDHISKDQNHCLDNTASDTATTKTITHATSITKGLKDAVVRKIKKLFEHKKATDLDSSLLHKCAVNPIRILDSALQTVGMLTSKGQDLRWILYLSDVGGHAAGIPRDATSSCIRPFSLFSYFPSAQMLE